MGSIAVAPNICKALSASNQPRAWVRPSRSCGSKDGRVKRPDYVKAGIWRRRSNRIWWATQRAHRGMVDYWPRSGAMTSWLKRRMMCWSWPGRGRVISGPTRATWAVRSSFDFLQDERSLIPSHASMVSGVWARAGLPAAGAKAGHGQGPVHFHQKGLDLPQ